MKFDELKLTSGYQIQLQVSSDTNVPFKYNCRFVGSIPGKTVMVTSPRQSGKGPRLRPGLRLLVRLMIDNGICVFPATIEHMASAPFPILHLSMPASISFKEIRGATRVDVDQALSATNVTELDEPSAEGVFADISTSGARLELASAIGKVGDQLELLCDVNIGRLVRTLRVKAVIRSRIERSTKEIDHNLPAVYGIEFVETDEDVLLVLYAYVYSEMAASQMAEAERL